MSQWEGRKHRVSFGQCSLDSGSGVHSVYFGTLTIASGNSDNFNSLFDGAACPKLYQRVRQQINIVEKFGCIFRQP